jgi:hypothetical protein
VEKLSIGTFLHDVIEGQTEDGSERSNEEVEEEDSSLMIYETE